MRKAFAGLLALLFVLNCSYAQSKVFREVSSEIASQVRTIRQDNAVVGYLVFTTLEKASEDSFNYRITIMDENLNDVGVVNFREQSLGLHDVSFEQDVLCLAYVKENISGKRFRKREDYFKAKENNGGNIFMQFLGLDGKILNTMSVPMKLSISNGDQINYMIIGRLENNIQLKNIPQYGFACFYGEKDKKHVLAFKANGETSWKKVVKETAQSYTLLTSPKGVHLLIKKNEQIKEGGFELLSYGVADSSAYLRYILKDKSGNSLKALSFDNDPVTGNPYVSGKIIDNQKGNPNGGAKGLFKGAYSGVFAINFNGLNKNDVQAVYTYWNDGSQSFVDAKGYYGEQKAYLELTHSFRDYQGNTYFTGPSVYKKARWEALAGAPLVFPLVQYFLNPYRVKIGDPFLIKQNAKGTLSFDNNIPTQNFRAMLLEGPISSSTNNNKSFYVVTNPDTQTNYLLVDDRKDISIYNVNTKKVSRTIPRKDGSISMHISPAKEGYIMVAEYNKKEKYTRVSIESL